MKQYEDIYIVVWEHVSTVDLKDTLIISQLIKAFPPWISKTTSKLCIY
jgi:hypothetical protein